MFSGTLHGVFFGYKCSGLQSGCKLQTLMVLVHLQVSKAVSNLGVLIDSQSIVLLRSASQCFFSAVSTLPGPVVTYIRSGQDTRLVNAFVSSCLDYCNCLLYGVSDNLLKKLQALQNSTARVVTGIKKFDHITPVLCNPSLASYPAADAVPTCHDRL